MVDIKNTSDIIIDRSMPEFIRSDNPMFEAFLRAYYEFLEQSKQPNDIIEHLRDYRNIDQTIDEFIEFFRKEYLVNIPADILADKRLLVKQIKNFYLNKGNENSYKFLFRILYDEDIEFYYPKVDILKASDGKWQQTTSIKILQDSLTPEDLDQLFNGLLTGSVSHARAKVESILSYSERGVAIYELNLLDIHGEFIDGERVIVENITATLPNIFVMEVVSGINITNGGFQYKLGDIVYIKDTTSDARVGKGRVIRIKRGPVTGFSVIDGGTGYRGEFRQVKDFAFLPINYTWQTIYLPNATIEALASNDYDFAPQTISFPITAELIPDVGDPVVVTDTPDPIGIGAAGKVYIVSPTGEIVEVELLSGGKDYSLPIADVISATGTGANIKVLGGGGDIVKVKLDTFPIVKRDINGADTLVADFTAGSGSGAEGDILMHGGTIKYPGTFINEDGKLSSRKKLQDNFFYQDFSYVVLSKVSHQKWRDIVKKIIHPAGLKEFGLLKLKSENKTEQSLVKGVTISTQTKIFMRLADGSDLLYTDGGHILI